MNLFTNLQESVKAIRDNLLRTVLTALIIAIGITALVGILTAIDGIQASVDDSFASLGVNSFTVQGRSGGNRRQRGRAEKTYPPLDFQDTRQFTKRYQLAGHTSVRTRVTGNAEAKRGSLRTNPNLQVEGTDEQHLIIEGLRLRTGRNFSAIELDKGSNVAIIGADIVGTLFAETEDPINKRVSLFGIPFKVIGVLEEKGAGPGDNVNRKVFIPIIKARQVAVRDLAYTITVSVSGTVSLPLAMGEATSLMRIIRQDPIGGELSFEVEQKKSLGEELGEITGYLRIGGFTIGLITLLGASIALMNIMMVSVTERTREIGVRKALGATPQRIRQQFLMEAIVICQLGGLLGVILGIGIGNGVAQLMNVERFIIPWVWIIAALLICVAVGLFSGYYPAYRASRLDPIDSLRFE
jgi:putative ABC transport system permease protein